MQNFDSQQHQNSNDKIETFSISLITIYNEFLIWERLLKKYFWILSVFSIISSITGYIYANYQDSLYYAHTRFMLKNEGVGSLFGGQMTGLASLLGGGQMGTPLERTAEVIASDRILGRVLLKKIKVRDSIDLVINHFIRLSNLKEKWSKDKVLYDVTFSINENSIELLKKEQRQAFKIVKSLLSPEKGLGVVRKSFDKKSGVLTITCVHRDEAFAIELSNSIYAELSVFFVEQMTYSASNNAQVMRNKLDSIQSQLTNVRKLLASEMDQSLGLLLQKDKVDIKNLTIKEQMLNIMYAEALKNYEAYQFINQAAIPTLTLIDYPYSPIKPNNKSKIIYTIIPLIISMIMLLLYFRISLFINDSIKQKI